MLWLVLRLGMAHYSFRPFRLLALLALLPKQEKETRNAANVHFSFEIEKKKFNANRCPQTFFFLQKKKKRKVFCFGLVKGLIPVHGTRGEESSLWDRNLPPCYILTDPPSCSLITPSSLTFSLFFIRIMQQPDCSSITIQPQTGPVASLAVWLIEKRWKGRGACWGCLLASDSTPLTKS